jgi:arylformamidase
VSGLPSTVAAAPPPEWFDAQYNNRARVPEHLEILAQWTERSERTRAGLACKLDVAYGSDPTERLDIFSSTGPEAPILVHVHGGYWRALDKRDHSFVAAPFVDAGAMVVVPNYALCPAVGIEHIVLQLVRALVWLWRHATEHGGDPTRIVVAGHSAGGHLAAMLLACDWRAVDPELPTDLVRAALAVSGVFDLEPLRHAPFLAPALNLDAASARRLSPAVMPAPRGRLVAVVGGDESEEFLRQSGLIADAWDPRAVCERIPGRHHMNVLDDLVEPGARTHRLALELLGLDRASPPGALSASARALPPAPPGTSSRHTARSSRPIAPPRGSG